MVLFVGFGMKKLRPLPFPVLPENARDGENSVVPPLLSRLQNALPAPLKTPLNAGKSGGLRPGTRLPADWVSFFPGQFADRFQPRRSVSGAEPGNTAPMLTPFDIQSIRSRHACVGPSAEIVR